MEENTPILEELITLRQKQADLLGYPNHAAYILEERMANNPTNVQEFLTNLADKLQVLWKQERVDMLKLKKEEVMQGVTLRTCLVHLNIWASNFSILAYKFSLRLSAKMT